MKVMVAIDQSDFWMQIVDSLTKRKWPAETQFKVLTVIEPLPFHWEQICFEDWKKTAQEILDKRKQAANNVLAKARQKISEKFPDCVVHTELRYGRALDEIVGAATEWVPEKLVLGAHGRSPNRLFPDAVSHSVARHASCNIELVRLHPLPGTTLPHAKPAAEKKAEPKSKSPAKTGC